MTQGGQGATPERMRRGRVETRQTMQAGEIAQVDRWPDFVTFLHDEGMVDEYEFDGWTDYLRFKQGKGGSDRTGTGGDGNGYQAWIDFGKLIGPKKLLILDMLASFQAPVEPISLEAIEKRVKAESGAFREAEERYKALLATRTQHASLKAQREMQERLFDAAKLTFRLMARKVKDALDASGEAAQAMRERAAAKKNMESKDDI